MINGDWSKILKDEFEKEYFKTLSNFLDDEYGSKKIFPPREEIFNALNYCSYNDTKVVILGQDPYHGDGQAHGLSFSVKYGVDQPPSLKNIFKELETDLGIKHPNHGCLESWANQGVLLLNASLTVEESKPNSHSKKGWTIFTDIIIQKLNEREKPIIFLLWGNNALQKLGMITGKQHFVLSAAHPSPLSATRGFFGCRHFSKTNMILSSLGEKQIDWQINNI